MRSSKTVAGDLSEGPQRLLRGCQLKSAGCLGLGANTSSTKVNAFSRLMAPEGKTQKNKIGFSGNYDGGISLQQLSETKESGVAGQ